MLPDIRAVFAAFVAAIGLLMIAFAAVAAFRVAQESRVASLQSDLAQRGQAVPPQTGQRVAVIETPGPHIAPPPPLPVVEIRSAPVGAEVSSIPLLPATQPEPEAAPVAIAAPREEVTAPVTEASIGGPLAEPAPAWSETDRAAARQERARTLAAAKRARQLRLTRQRKAAAARRAALARENAKQAATSPFNSGFGSQGPGGFGAASPGFGNSGFGSTFGKQ
jgi:type IV secretory pathway VirB10-like protein